MQLEDDSLFSISEDQTLKVWDTTLAAMKDTQDKLCLYTHYLKS